ncbi:hypothetical protein PGT21_031130 [Puccinia graminis f. sp. tritici]|uniref:Uncharacterized protein n=1 Tax=Puccinia graminis f. sp. tritici TaxID=56615 RepID=A0A5B0LXS5_PUCGR|nr:hypothetical protein PGT21_031130 [Puccinia graminis f. sp. tritici]
MASLAQRLRRSLALKNELSPPEPPFPLLCKPTSTSPVTTPPLPGPKGTQEMLELRVPADNVRARHIWNSEPGCTTRLPTPLWSDLVIHTRPQPVTQEL